MSAERFELFKSGLSLMVALVTLALGWGIGQRLTIYWNLRQKHREYDLATAHEFHKLYGEFFAVWKVWNDHLRGPTPTIDARNALFDRACTAEGGLESLFVRLASSRALTDEQTKVLGRFRQGYQSLRQAVRDGRPLEWHSSSHPQYAAFKSLAAEVAVLVAMEGRPGDGMPVQTRAQSLLRITSNEWEATWWGQAPTSHGRDSS